MYVNGLISDFSKGLTNVSTAVTSIANPIIQARQQYATIKSLWKDPFNFAPSAGGPMTAPVASMVTAAPASRALSNGAEMRELQTRLQNFGINPGPIDGVYGTKTAAGIRQFQAQAGMAQDGKATTAVLNLLRQAAAAPPPLREGPAIPTPILKPAPQTQPQPVQVSSASLRNGSQIQELQTHLQTMGIDPGPIDGVYGTKTAAGIRQFQGLAGLPQDGKATVTLLAMARAMAPVVAAKQGSPSTSYPGFPPTVPAPAPAPSAPAAPASGAMPAWVIPAAGAGAALLLFGVMAKRKGRR